MKKALFNILALASLTALFFLSCDKIDEEQYIVFAGATGEWYYGNGVDDHSQRAFLEKYTGVRCVACPTADQVIASAQSQYGGKLIAVAIHDSCLAFTRPFEDNPDFRTPDGDAWSKFFGIFDGSYPKALINRPKKNDGNWDIITPTGGFNNTIDSIINSETKVAIATSAVNQDDAIDITVDLEFLQTVSGDLTLTLLIMEDGIVAKQRQPDGSDMDDYVHNHVLRDVITDIWGDAIDCTGTAGEKRYARFSYTQKKEEWNLDNCHIVAFVSDKASKYILNVAECEIE